MSYHQYHSCERKVRYRSKQKALNNLKSIRKTGVIIPANATAYECKYCEGWHLGHDKKGLHAKDKS